MIPPTPPITVPNPSTYAWPTDPGPLLVRALLEERLGDPGAVDLRVHSEDEMLSFASEATGGRDDGIVAYFASGLSIWTTWRGALEWHFGRLDRIGRVLDFASGFGRVTRFLVREIPPERVTVADILAPAVAFQADHFGVHGLVSSTDPEAFLPTAPFDVILVASLFTHLPDRTFRRWLRRLGELLTPGGLLAFSVHDAGLLPPDERPASGLRFDPHSESRTLDLAEYGTTWVSEAYVRAAIAEVMPRSVVHRAPRALCNFHDVFLVSDGPCEGAPSLPLEPHGFVDRVALDRKNRLAVRGWAVDPEGGPVTVEIAVDRHHRTRVRADIVRTDVADHLGLDQPVPCGFSAELDLPPGLSRAESPVLVRACSRRRESVLHLSTLEGAVNRGLSEELTEAHRERDALRAEASFHRARFEEAERALIDCGWEAEVLRRRIAAMEASRFWRLRERWFSLKSRLRIGDSGRPG